MTIEHVENPTQNVSGEKNVAFQNFLASIVSLNGPALLTELDEAEKTFPALVSAVKYICFQMSASAVAGSTSRRGNVVADCGPAVAEFVINAANSVVQSPDMARSLTAKVNSIYMHGQTEKSVKEGYVVEARLIGDPVR
ncbi:hypothetical protein OG943_20300 [Amycolatopsis sp. NBC_00345]|uniref:hypothetical protein n=1 Tax=Amycolatopsis sp. NBC_00345 TaxID=2975955 RepID=UPI002E25C193